MIAFYFNLWTLAKSRSEQLTHPIWALDEPKVNIVWPHQRPQACYKLRRSYDTQAVKHAHSSQGQNRNFSRLPHFIFLSRDLRVSSTRNLSPLNFLFPNPSLRSENRYSTRPEYNHTEFKLDWVRLPKLASSSDCRDTASYRSWLGFERTGWDWCARRCRGSSRGMSAKATRESPVGSPARSLPRSWSQPTSMQSYRPPMRSNPRTPTSPGLVCLFFYFS